MADQAAQDLQNIFPGDSEMARRMRAFDWTASSLGAPQRWPAHLRSAVSLCLTSRFPILLWWGQDLTLLYNDAYVSFLGSAKHPAALARPGREVWGEIWDTIGPMLQGVLATGVATWSEDVQYFFARHLPMEEVFVRFTYGPILSPDGRVDGVFTPCTETTAAVVGARRLQALTRLRIPDARSASLADACAAAIEALAGHEHDVPFAALYLREGGQARCVNATAAPATTGLPPVVSLDADDGPAAIIAAALRDAAADRAAESFAGTAGLDLPGGPYPEPAGLWLAVPLSQRLDDGEGAALVLAASPRCPVDAAYRDFFALVARHVGDGLATASRYQQQRARVEALAQLDRAKTVFFSNISHELRTPLTLIQGPVEAMLQNPAPPDREDLGLVLRNARRLHKLVNALLDFSRLEGGRLRAEMEPTDLAAATAEIASWFRASMEAAGLKLVVDCPPQLRAYRVDRDMWEKVVSNLLSNALKYTLSGEVRVRLREQHGAAILEVADTGIGIAAADQPRLFERFYRVDHSRGRTDEGAGIGLALVRELVSLHGGTIEVESRADEGSTFTVTLPAGLGVAAGTKVKPWHTALAPAVDATQPRADGTAASGRRKERRPLILIADDNEDMRSYLSGVLAPHWDTRAVADGEAALAAIAAQLPDLLLSDVMMPRLDGLALIRRLRSEARTARLPVIVLSARAGEDGSVAGLSAGADDYLVKPFAPKELLARVESQLMRSRLGKVERQFMSRLAAVLEQAPVGIAVTSGPEHVFEFANEHYRRFVPGRTLIGRTLRENFPDLEGQGIFEIFDEIYRSGERFVASPLKVRLRSPDSGAMEDRSFDLVYQPLVGPDGAVNGVAVVASDVHAAVTARADAEAANRAKDEFIAMLGHELRNPLAPITTAVQLMKLRTGELAERELSIIDRQVRHMVRLVDDLLDVSRITRGAVELKRAPVELWTVVTKAVETSAPLIEQRRHSVQVNVATRGLPVLADLDRLSQVLSNLLTNAAKYTPVGGRIEVRAARVDAEVVLEVADTGVGLTPQEQERVFDLFVQGAQRTDRPIGGLGLGLSIARSLTVLHGGRLTCSSDGIGHGSTFAVTLPMVAGAADDDAAASRSTVEAAVGGDARQRVLVVDDNADAAQMLGAVLESWGCTVTLAHDGLAALELLGKARFDLALLDIGLPVMDGYEVARRIRAAPGGQRVRLVAVTGFGQASDRELSLASGFEDHLVKPVDIERLARLLLH